MDIKTHISNQSSKGLLWLSSLVLYLVAVACATPAAPTGGPQDTRPPQLDKKRYSTPNGITNFPYQRVILSFDEWIKLQGASQKVIISPPLSDKPTIKVRNKSVVVFWKESLKDSTTYLIQFGESVQDITEGNAAKNLQLVFSTGAFLDSLTCSGEVLLAETREPAADTWVMLYRDLADSVPLTQKPYYFTQTDASGRFNFKYLRGGRYQIIALSEKSNDYIYNSPRELIGFLDSTFIITDTIQPYLRLSIFQERLALNVNDVDVEAYGQVRLTLNQVLSKPLEIGWMGSAPTQQRIEQGRDSLRLWFDNGAADTLPKQLLLYDPVTQWRDTLDIRAKSRQQFMEEGTALRWYVRGTGDEESQETARLKGNRKGNKGKTSSLRPTIDTSRLSQHPMEPLGLWFTQPITAWDTSRFKWSIDTSVTKIDTLYQEVLDTVTAEVIGMDTTIVKRVVDTFFPMSLPRVWQDSAQAARLWLAIDSTSKRRYTLRLLPGALEDFFGRKNTDTLSRIYEIAPIDQYGSLTLRLVHADSSKQYLIALLNNKKRAVHQAVVQDSSTYTLVYPYLPTGSYQVRVSTDLDRNGRWDVGSYEDHRQPEPRTIGSPNPLKPGWDNELEIDLNPKATPQKGKRPSAKGDLEARSPKKNLEKGASRKSK